MTLHAAPANPLLSEAGICAPPSGRPLPSRGKGPARLLRSIVLACALPLPMGEAADAPGKLRVGLARVDITPSNPVTLAGYAGRKGLSQGLHDPLSARVTAFEHNGDRLVLISTDIIGFYNGTAEPLRQTILESCGLAPAELFLSAVHTHSGPALALAEGSGHSNNVAYTQTLQAKLVQATRQALDNLAPAQLGPGLGSAPIGVNRREQVQDNAGNPKIRLGRNPSGVTDPEVQVLNIAAEDGILRAVLFGYATHSTSLGYDNYRISGDVHGLAEQFVERYLDVIAPAFAGASGDIDPWFRVLPEFHTHNNWVPEPILMGTWLGQEVVHVARKIKTTPLAGPIKTAFRTLQLPGKPRGESQTAKDSPPAPLNISVGRVGAIGFVGWGGEILSEIGLAIKTASPFQPTFILTHCNGAAGYLPPKQAYLEGGYEVDSSPFAPAAAEQVVRVTLRMLNDL